MKNARHFLILLVLALCACSASVQGDMKAAQEKADLMGRMLNTDITEWRYQIGDIPNGQDPKLDDSGWQTATGSAFHWGTQPLAWLRTRITIPQDIAGIGIAGSKVTFKFGVDDDGTCYVDGRKVQDFHWDQGSVVLTEHAEPGQTFDIAIRDVNAGGDGRLLMARLDYSVLAAVSDATTAYLAKYNYARELLSTAGDDVRAKYETSLVKSVDTVNLESLPKGQGDYLTSLDVATALLDPMNELVRGINIDLVGHAHIDMNWLWLWPETLDVCRNTFNSISTLMDDFPGFKFSQSQPAVYAAMQETAPDVFAKIKERVKRGQWDTTTAAAWVEGDLNMSSGESIVRSILYGKRYMKKEFGIESDMCWEPDTFGHPVTMPQILAKSGIKYYYFMRCDIGSPLFWWQSPDGSRVLAYSYGPYNKGLDAGVGVEAARFAKQTGVDTYMHVYGVGDHGGGPTREMLNNENELSARTDFPRLQFSTPRDYFQTALKAKSDYRVWTSDLNTTFQGCYTSHADVKRWNRECENLLPTAEAFSVIAGASGVTYPGGDFEKSWRKTCFNQFHDILCGTAIHGSYEYSGKLRGDVVFQGKSALDKSLAAIAGKINTKGKGVPVIVFNPLAWPRTDTVSVPSPIDSIRKSADTYYLDVTDSNGKRYEAQVTGSTLTFTARNIPAMGYKVFWLHPEAVVFPSLGRINTTEIQNQFYKVTIDPKFGVITGIYDKVNKRSVLAPSQNAALLQILSESDPGMSAWNIGAIQGTTDVTGVTGPVQVSSGPVRRSLAFECKWDKSKFKQEVVLYDAVPRIDIKLTADWHQVWNGSKPMPFLKAAFSADLKDPKATFEVPFGSIERPRDGREVPGQKWIDMSDGAYGLSLLNDCKYGFDVKGSTMRISLLRSSHDPDPNPDEGIHEATYSLYPHSGDWRAAGTPRRGYELNEPLIAVSVPSHAGPLPAARSFLSISAPNVIVTALKKAEDDNALILRFYETDGKACKATIRTALPVRSYIECDLMERPVGKKLPITKGVFSVNVGKCEIKTYKLIR